MARPSAEPARPQLMRAMNEQILLDLIRHTGPLSHTELVQGSGLSKATVTGALTRILDTGLVHTVGRRTGRPGPAAALYDIRPQAGYVLALDVGHEYLRGALVDLRGRDHSRASVPVSSGGREPRIREVISFADSLCSDADIDRNVVIQTVIGTPGVYDSNRDALDLVGSHRHWGTPSALAELRDAFGPQLMLENDIDAAALAELRHGHGRDVDSFAFVSVGTGVGMGLVIGGRLHRGAHGIAGEIAYLPFSGGLGTDAVDARHRGEMEASASGAAVVRAAKRLGMSDVTSAQALFAAAAAGDAGAAAIVAEEATLIAKTVGAIVLIVDPDLIVLGGGIGRAPGFASMIEARLRTMTPIKPPVKVSALGVDAVVDGCLVSGLARVWSAVADGPHSMGVEAISTRTSALPVPAL